VSSEAVSTSETSYEFIEEIFDCACGRGILLRGQAVASCCISHRDRC